MLQEITFGKEYDAFDTKYTQELENLPDANH